MGTRLLAALTVIACSSAEPVTGHVPLDADAGQGGAWSPGTGGTGAPGTGGSGGAVVPPGGAPAASGGTGGQSAGGAAGEPGAAGVGGAAGQGGAEPSDAGAAGVPGAAGVGGQGGTGGGVVIDPLEPFPAPNCPGFTAYRVPDDTCIHVRGRFEIGSLTCPNPETVGVIQRCATGVHDGQCSNGANGCDEYGNLLLYVRAEEGRAFAVDRYTEGDFETSINDCAAICTPD